jgi:hypothetical protein
VLGTAEEVVEDDVHSGVYFYDHWILLTIETPKGAVLRALGEEKNASWVRFLER